RPDTTTCDHYQLSLLGALPILLAPPGLVVQVVDLRRLPQEGVRVAGREEGLVQRFQILLRRCLAQPLEERGIAATHDPHDRNIQTRAQLERVPARGQPRAERALILRVETPQHAFHGLLAEGLLDERRAGGPRRSRARL